MAYPERGLQSPCSGVELRAPAASSASRQPSTRRWASIQSSGPEMWCTVAWPWASRCSVAKRAPWYWSTATTGTPSSGPASTATTGRSDGRSQSALVAATWGAITKMPSTPRSRSRSPAWTISARSSVSTLATLTK